MKRTLSGKIALVAGGSEEVIHGIVQSLLMENAIVVSPAKSASHIRKLQESVGHVKKGRLVTMLADIPDCDRAKELFDDIIEEFGQIDLAVIAPGIPSASMPLTEVDAAGWHKMIDENITSFFLCGRIVLDQMKKNKQGMYFSIGDTDKITGKTCSALSSLASKLELEMARIFAREVKTSGVTYHHLFVNSVSKAGAETDKENKGLAPDAIGQFIVKKYYDQPQKRGEMFQWLLGCCTKEDEKMKQAIKQTLF